MRGSQSTARSTAEPAGVGARLRISYVLAVWGERYIDRYFDFAFPTHLSPGNLPALARDHELSFVVLTRSADRAAFEQHARFPALRALGPVELVDIDDLISHPGVFTVTLTLAFTRAMRLAGEAAVDTCFMFMNADFLLADGTLATAARRIADGAGAVLAASPRAIAEQIGPRVAALPKEANGALTIAPREAVAMALAAPHAMVLAKQPRVTLLHSEQANQYFWFHDRHTLLARSFIMFMLAVKPKHAGYRATSYCDYSLVADLVNPEDVSVIEDSDDGFILELQSRAQEMDTVRLGALTEVGAAAHLAEWTTRHHREIAGHDLVFHSRDLPPDLETTRAEARAYIDTILAALPSPVEAHRHPYWLGGLDAWRFHRPDSPLPEEVAPLPRPVPPAGGQPAVADFERAPARGHPGEVRRVAQRIYDLALPLRHALLADPTRGDLTSLLSDLLSSRRGGSEIMVYGDRIPFLRTRFPLRRIRHVQSHALTTDDLGTLPFGSRLIVSLGDDDLERLPAAFALADHALRQGVQPGIAVARRRLRPEEFNLALTHALTSCDVHLIHRARTILRDGEEIALTRRQFQRSLAGFREMPTVGRLALTSLDTARLATAQLRLRWPALLQPWRTGATISGVVILMEASRSDRTPNE